MVSEIHPLRRYERLAKSLDLKIEDMKFDFLRSCFSIGELALVIQTTSAVIWDVGIVLWVYSLTWTGL